LSKEIAQTVGGKRIAWLIAIIAAFAVFATVGSGWRSASASELSSADNSQTVLMPSTASTSADSVNLPDIRGSTDGAINEVVNFTSVVGSTVSAVNVSLMAEPGFWAFVAATVAFVVLLRVASLGTLVECAEPRYVRRQDLGMYNHRKRNGLPLNSLAHRSTWLRTADISGISKRSGLKRASHVTIARDNTMSSSTTTTTRKTHPVTSAIFGRLHAVFSTTAVGAVRTSVSYFRRAIASAGTAMISSLKRLGAGSAYPLIAHKSFVRFASASRTTALATPRQLGESESLHNSFNSLRRATLLTFRSRLSNLMTSQPGTELQPALTLRL
jgi:hypothetical protein